ncbi:MAG: porin [Pseudomonadota bacterium]
MTTLKKCILTLTTIASLTIGVTTASFASDDVNARIEALESALKELRNEVKARDEKIAAMEIRTAEIDKMPKFSNSKLEMESHDGKFSMGIAGRIQADAYAIDDAGSSKNPMGNGMELRRVRLGAYGKMYGDWKYKFEVEYAGDKVTVKDAFIETTLAKNLNIRAGHFKEYYGIDNLTSDNTITFMERALSNVYWPEEAMGVGLTYTDGKFWGAQAGIFTPGVVNGGTTDDTDWAATGRIYAAPEVAGGKVHVGLNGSYRSSESSLTTATKFEQRPESHIAEKTLRTGNITNPDSETRFGPEVAANFGAVTVQAQYDWSTIERLNGAPAVSTDGGYVEASWFVTGEKRNYSVKTGTFSRTDATNAIQLAARVSHLDFSDAALTDARRGVQDDVTFGANYYFNPNVRLMLNYVLADLDYTVGADETYNIVQSRIQLDW